MIAKIKPFRKLIADENSDLIQELMSDGLLARVFLLCAIRARWKTSESPKGLKQGEFWLSRMEYDKFGIKATQAGQIERRMMKLKRMKIVSKLDRRIDNDGATIWRFLSNELIDMNYKTDSPIDNEQTTNRQRIDTNKNGKNDKNDKNTHHSIEYLTSINSGELEELARDLQVTQAEIITAGKTASDWCKSTGKKYVDYKAFLRNWIRRDRKVEVAKPTDWAQAARMNRRST